MERHERFSKTWLGDIILTAAFVVFAGPLSLKFRKRCWKEWSKLLNSMSIESTKILDSSLKDESDNETQLNNVRYLIVIDNTSPTIDLSGNQLVTIERGSAYNEPGFVVTDAKDTLYWASDWETENPTTIITGYTYNRTFSGTGTSTINTLTNGDFTLTYSITDPYANTATKIRNIKIEDTTPPNITINGTNPIEIELGSTYTDAGATAVDPPDNIAITGENFITTNTVNSSVAGDYTVTYQATDDGGNTSTAIRDVQVRDTTNPTLTLTGADPYYHPIGNPFDSSQLTDYTVSDNQLDPVTVTITDDVNINSEGSYTITYTATDASNNSTQKTRTVIVDGTQPTLTLNGANPYYHTKGQAFDMETMPVNPPYTASDTNGVTVVTSGTVDINTEGTYTITYTATDNAGNQTVKTRTVIIDGSNYW